MKTKLTTLAALLGLTISAAAQSAGSGTSRVGGIIGSSNADTNTAGGSLNVANPNQPQTFQDLDSNKDDILSKEELSRMRGDNDANKLLIQQWDTNADGSLTKEEYARMPARTGADQQNAANDGRQPRTDATNNRNSTDARNNTDAQNNTDARNNNEARNPSNNNNTGNDNKNPSSGDTKPSNSAAPRTSGAGSPGATSAGNAGPQTPPN